MAKRKLRLTVALACLVVFVVVGVAGGCNAYRRPPALNEQESQLLRALPLPYSVTVAPWDAKTAFRMSRNTYAYAEALALILIPTGAFRTSHFRNNAQATDGDLIATSTGTYCNRAVIPLFTILSLGIIPTVFDDEDCVGMVLRRSGASEPAPTVRIEIRNKHPVVMGWAGVIMGILPGWSYGSCRNDTRFRQRLRLEVIRHQSDIERLTRP